MEKGAQHHFERIELVAREGPRVQGPSSVAKTGLPSTSGRQDLLSLLEGRTFSCSGSSHGKAREFKDSSVGVRIPLAMGFSGSSHTSDFKLALQWLPYQAPGIIGSALGLVGPVSVY